MKVPAALAVAALAALISTAILGAAELRVVRSGGGASPDEMVPFLMALAALCLVGLTLRRYPSGAWLASIAALTITTIDLAALGRAARPALDDASWSWLSIAICMSALFAAGAAVAYAATRWRHLGAWVPIVGIAAVAALLAACASALAHPAGAAFVAADELESAPLGTLNLVTRTFLLTVLGFTAVGLLGDTRLPARRAAQRLAAARPAPVSLRERIAYAGAWTRMFVDESTPGRSRAHRAALAERSRLARELHAEVVPAVRRALAEAERDGSPERLSASLRGILLEVDALAQSQHAIQLEVGGLVPALEWLSERVEDRSDVRVTLDVADVSSGPAGRPPSQVAAAAYRVAQLALENVVRHAPRANVTVETTVEPTAVALSISDDGPGIPDGAERAATALGRRGLADMRGEAAGCGAALSIGSRADGPGTVVQFRWPGG